MSRQFRLWKHGQVVNLLEPAADAAGRTSPYLSVFNAHKAFIICHINQGNAAQVTLSPLQAKDTSGTSSKAIAAAPIAADLDTVTSDALAEATAAATYQTDVAVKKKIVIFEIDPAESMDLANGFNHLAVSTSASNAANITAALLVLLPLRYAQTTPPTAQV